MSPAKAAALLGLLSAVSGEPRAVRGHMFVSGTSLIAVPMAVSGAARRLESPECLRVLDDFQDAQGQPLSAALSSRGMTAAEFLSSLYFADGDRRRACAADSKTAAYTAPGRRVVFVCERRFMNTFSGNQRYAEVVIIHEMLHALGLGENPPTSAAITEQVMRRCGR